MQCHWAVFLKTPFSPDLTSGRATTTPASSKQKPCAPTPSGRAALPSDMACRQQVCSGETRQHRCALTAPPDTGSAACDRKAVETTETHHQTRQVAAGTASSAGYWWVRRAAGPKHRWSNLVGCKTIFHLVPCLGYLPPTRSTKSTSATGTATRRVTAAGRP